MTHLLDTNHLSLLQHHDSPDRAAIVLRINLAGEGNVCASVVSFHEQMQGANAFIKKARNPQQLVRAYGLLSQIIHDYTRFVILEYTEAATERFAAHGHLQTKIGTMDLRIAAIALAHDLTLVTANTSDFAQVPGLRLEDWTR